MGKWGHFLLLTSCLVRTEDKSSCSVGILTTKWGRTLQVVALLWAHVSRPMVCVPFLCRIPWTVGFGFHPNSMWSMVSFCGGRNVVQLPAEMSGLQRKVGNTVTTWREGRRLREGPHFSFTQLLASRLPQGHWWANSNSSTLSPSKHAHPLYLFYSSWDLWAEHFSQGHRVNNKLGFRSNLTECHRLFS